MVIIPTRRKLITGIASLFVAPAIIKVSAIMPINSALVPDGIAFNSMAHPYPLIFYGLRGREVVPLADVNEWAAMFEGPKRFIRQDRIGDVFVSTVFLGIDHGLSSPGDHPVVFETMAFQQANPERPKSLGDELLQDRYCTYDEAERGHARAVRRVREIQAMAKLGIKT